MPSILSSDTLGIAIFTIIAAIFIGAHVYHELLIRGITDNPGNPTSNNLTINETSIFQKQILQTPKPEAAAWNLKQQLTEQGFELQDLWKFLCNKHKVKSKSDMSPDQLKKVSETLTMVHRDPKSFKKLINEIKSGDALPQLKQGDC